MKLGPTPGGGIPHDMVFGGRRHSLSSTECLPRVKGRGIKGRGIMWPRARSISVKRKECRRCCAQCIAWLIAPFSYPHLRQVLPTSAVDQAAKACAVSELDPSTNPISQGRSGGRLTWEAAVPLQALRRRRGQLASSRAGRETCICSCTCQWHCHPGLTSDRPGLHQAPAGFFDPTPISHNTPA